MVNLTKMAAIGLFVIANSNHSYGQQPPAPPPTPDVQQKITLNNRVFLNAANVYDPTYGLLRIGYIKDNVLSFLPTNKPIRNIEMPNPQSKNFAVYSFTSKEGVEGKVDIPIIGSASAAKDQVVYANMEDISEVYAPPASVALSTCEIWSLIDPNQIQNGSTVIFTDHAVFSKIAYGVADKQAGEAKASIGTFISVGASAYKQAASETKVPLISVTGVQFVVDDVKKFCTASTVIPEVTNFRSINDLVKPNNLLVKGIF